MENNNIYLDFIRQLGENGSAVDNNEQNKEKNKDTEQQSNANNQADATAVTEVRDDMDKAFDNTNAFEQYANELQNRTKYNDASNEKLLGVVSDVAKGNKPYYHLSMQGQQDAYEAQKELNKRLASGDIAYDVQPKKEVAKNKSGYYIYDPENEHNEFLNLSDQQLSAKMKDVKSKLDAMSGTEADYADTFKIAEKLNEAITYRNKSHEANDPALRAAIEKENKQRQAQQKAQQQKAIESTDSYKLNLWIKKNLSEEDKYDTIYNSTGYNEGAKAAYGLSQQEKIQIAYAYTQDKSHSLADQKNFVRGVFSGTQEQGAGPGIPRYLGENMLRKNIENSTTKEEKDDSTNVYNEYVKIVKAESPGKSNSYIDKAENEALAKFIASYQKASADNAKLAEENYNKSFGFLRDGEDIEMANLKRASQHLTGVDIAGLIRKAWDSMDPNTMRAYAVRLAESRGEMTEQGIQKAQNELVDTFYKDCIKYVKDDIPEGAFGVIQNAFANSIAGNFWQGAIRGGNVNNNELTLLDVYQQGLQESDQNYNKNGWSGAVSLIGSKALQMALDTPAFGGIGRVASTATKPLLKPFVSLAVGKWVPKAVYNSAFNAFASTGGGRLVVGVTSGAMTGALFNPISMLSQSYATGQSASFGEYLSGAATGALHFGAMGFTPIIGNHIIKPINKVFSGTGKAQTIARTMGNVVVQDVISPGLNAAIVTGLENWREIVKHGISPDLVTEYARTYGEFIGMHLGGKVSHLGKGKLVNNLKAMYGYKTALQQQCFTKSEIEAINNSEAVANIKRIINESATIGDAEMKQISELHKEIIADNTIPEGAKLKLFSIVGDSAIATPTITNVERVEEGGKHVVKVYTAEGKLFSSNEFSSKSQADNEVKRISNITEKNKILATQSTFDAVWFQQVTNDATRTLAEAKGVDVAEMSKQLGEIAERSKSGAEISSEDKSLLKEFDGAIKTAVNNTTLQNSEQLKNSYKNVGVSIDDILSKDYSQWTKSDKELVERYVDTMNSAISKDNERKNAMIRRREVASIIKQSFDEGNSLEDAQSINDTALRVNALENSLGDHLTDELRSEILNDPVSAYERVRNDDNLSAPVKERILEYITTRAKFDGFVSSVNERIDTEIEASNTAIDAITHKSEGNVIEVELTDNAGVEKGKKVYVINGKLSTYGDSMVDYDKSDKTIAIIIEGDEKPRMISPSKIVRVVNNNSAEELKKSAREEIVSRISEESNNAVNGTINSVAIGDKISITNDEGNVVEAEVVQPTDKKGNPIAPKDGEVFIKVGEDIFSISMEQLSVRAGNAKYDAISNEYRIEPEPTSEDGIRVDLSKDETADNIVPEAYKASDAENIPQQEYKPGQFTLRENGEEKLAIVTGNVDEQGRIQYLVQGENEFRYATNDEMRELAKDYKPYEEEGNTMPEAEGNAMPEAEAKEVANVEQREAENEAEDVEQKVSDEFPVDENGKKDYVSAGADRTAKHIYDELGLEKENADELVENNIASATKELAKAEKAKGKALKGVTDPDEMAALQKSANEAVAKAKQKKELWEAVKAERAKQNEEEQNKQSEAPEGDAELQLTEADKPRPKQELNEKSKNDMQTIARSIGVELVFDESLKENGRYTTIDKATGKPTIHVAMNASNPLESVFGHEATHRVKSIDNESYGELHDVARLMIGDEEFFDRANRKKELYAKNGITLSDADAREEVVSDYIGSLIYDKEHMGKVADKLSKPILSKIRDVVSDFLDYFRRNKMTADERLAKGSLRAIDRAFARASGVHSMMGASALESEGDKKYNLRTEDELAELIRTETTKNRNDKKYKGIVFTEQEVESIIQESQELFKAIEATLDGNNFWDEWKNKNPEIVFDWRDGQMHPIVTWSRNNVEYKYDVSADLLCVNNESIEAILASPDMVKLMGIINDNQVGKGDKYQKGFNSDDYMRLYETLRDMGLNVPCMGCFDAAARLKMLASVSQKFVDLVNETVDRRNKNPEKFDAELRKKAEGESAKKITALGFLGSGESKKAAIEIGVAGDNLTEHITWEQLMSAKGQTKALKEWGGVFRAWQKTGAGRPKDKLLPEPYTGVMTNQTYTIIAPYGKSTPSFREQEVNTGTGLRRNSHSEYRPILIVDEIQFMRDCYLKNLLVFKYMKDLDDARLFGKFGVKMNMSFFPAWEKGAPVCGLDKNGNYLPSEESVGSREFVYTDKDGKQHFDGQKGFEEALKLCNEDVSLSSVVMSIPHLLKCMTDVPTHKDPKGIWGSLIPFHASGATAAQLFKQGLGMARAMKHFEEALTDYDKGVTNFEAVQNDRFGKGWKILEGKKKGTKVQEGHKLEFVNGTHYYNKELGLHLFSSFYVKDSELTQEQKDGLFLKTKMTDEERKKFKAELKKTVGTPFSIDYNNTVREIGGEHPYKVAADKLSDELRNMNLIPRFEFEVPEYIFLNMCADAKVDPKHPKLGWNGKGHGWSPTDSDAYYSLWCDYGMTDPNTGKYSPHRPVGFINEKGEREFRLPDNVVEIAKDSVERYTALRQKETDMYEDIMREYVTRSVAEKKLTQKQADEFLSNLEGPGSKYSLREYSAPKLDYEDGTKYSLIEDKAEIDRLNKERVETGYQNIDLKDDLSIGAPMASKLKSKGKGRVVTGNSQFGQWGRSEENPDLVDENGKIDLVKPDGKTVDKVDYNPYFHIRPYLFNKQFKQAWERLKLVFIETEFPASELTSGFKANKAKLSVGRHSWNGGDLILSRWTRPKAIVPWREVAPHWIKEFKESGVHFDNVPPALLNTLRDNGVKILPPHKGMGKNCFDAYEEFKKGNYNPEFITDEQIDAFNERINSGNTQSEKFSIRANDELEKKSLVGIHNLTDDNLRYAIKLGGLANPSTAVVDTNIMGLEGFGDISLIMPKSLVDKRTGKNVGTYAGDAYTPRFPNGDIVKHISSKGVEKINQDYQGNDQFSRDFREALRSYGSEYGGIAPTLYYLYKLENGGADVVKHEGPKIKSEAHRIMIDKYGEKEWSELSDSDKQELVEYRRKEIKESLKDVEKSKADKLVDKLINSSDFDTLAYKKFRSLKMDYNMQKNAGDVDYQGTYNKAENDVAMSGEYDKFTKWLDEKSIRYGIEDRIFRGYTPSGNRKYAPLTLSNISKVMKESGRAGSEAMMSGSPHSLRGKMLPVYKTLESIKKNKGMLSDEETYERIRGEIENEYNELISIIRDIKGVDYNDAYYILEDALLKGFDYAEREAGITIDSNTKERISAFGELLKESPVKYFETKFERPVMLNEFVAAVVPKDIDADLKNSLIDNGIAIEEYERGNEESRLEAVKRASNREDVKFSIREGVSEREAELRDAFRRKNPEDWKNVVELMKDTAIWEDVKNRYQELETDNEIADEVLAIYSGSRGAERLRDEQEKLISYGESPLEKATAVSAIARVKDALNRFWRGVANFLGIRYTNVEQVADKVLSDFLNGVKPNSKSPVTKYQIIGEKGAEALDKAQEATIRMDNLSVAREMEKAGKDAKTIRLATGWERGADGKWRYEIPDEIDISDDGQVLRNAINRIRLERLSEKLGTTTDALKTEIYNLKAEIEKRRQISNLEEQLRGIDNGDVSEDNKLEASKIRKKIEFYKSRLMYENSIDVQKNLSDLENSFDDVNELMLTDVFGKDNSLFKAYPKLADIVVKFYDKGYTSVVASVSDNGKEIWINPNSWISQSLLFLHEVQHAIQKIEGFSQGGYTGLFQIPKEHKYANLPGKEISRMKEEAEFARQELSKYNSYEELKDYYKSNRSVLSESKRNALISVLDAVYYGNSVEDAISSLEKEYQQAMGDLKWGLASNDSPYAKYNRLAGEVEARNVQARAFMSDQERREKLLADTEDVARKDQIFLFENGLAQRENDFVEDTKYSIRDDGSTIEGAEEAKPVTLRSILSDRNIGLKEQITLSKALLAEQNKSDKTLRKDFVRSLTDNLSDVRKAMSAQKVYDKATIKRVADLAIIMLSTGHLINLGKVEQQKLLLAIKNSAGVNNNDKRVQKIMDIMVSNQLKNGELALEALERKKGTRLDSKRVQHVGELDPAGNIMLDAFKKCRKMTDEKLSEQIGEYLSKMDSNDEAIADNASNAYAGAMIAKLYHEKIRTSIEDEQTLQDELKYVSRNEELKKNNPKSYRQLVNSIKDAIRQNRIDRAQAYYDLVGMLTNKMKDSAENAKQFKEAEKQRVKNIQHIANSDMQGRKLRGDRKDNTLEGINNFPVFRFFASPLANLDQMLRMLGGKNSYGRGYLWNHFMRGWADSADKEQVATEKYYDMLDKKASEIFGEKGYVFNGNPIKIAYRYTDLYSYAEDLPKATISYLDGGEMREYSLSQAELLYLYAVEKMPLGRATNRKMGISEEVMEQITNVLDEKLKRFADWTQEELLPSLGNEMNAVHRRMFGANMDSIENYFPFVRDKNAIKVEVENGNLKNFNDKISVKTGAIKKRTANVIKWDMPNCNFFKVLAKHVDEGCHWMGFAEINKDFSTLLSYNRFKQQVMNINSVYGNGDTLWKTFSNVCAIATDAYEPQRSESDELMVRIAKNVTLSKIAFNPMPAIKQLLSLPAFFGEIKPQYVMQSLLRGGVADVKWAWDNLPNYRKRVKSRMIGDYYLRDSEFEKKGGIVGLLQTAGDKFESLAKKGMIANIGIDAWTIAVGAYGVYRSAKDKYIRWGMSEEKAEERAKQDATLCYNKSQQSSEGPFMSKVQIDHTFFNTMMMLFRNAATSYTRETHASLRNLKRLVSGEVDYEYMAKQILRQAEIPTFSKLFDSELNRQAEGTLANDHDYSLGTPGGKLQSAGIEDKPINLFPELISAVAEQNGLEMKYFSGLVDAINNPVAVFNEDGQTRIVIETDGGNDHCIVDIQPNEEGYRVTNIEPLYNHPNGYKMVAESLLDLNATKYINQWKAKRMLKMSGVLSEFNKEDKKAIRNIANNFVNPMVPEQQNFSGWRKEDIDNAKKQAKREIVDSTAKNIVNTAIFGLVLPWAWRIGGAASLLLLSDDDDAKQEVIDDANRKAVTSGLEGIAYGDVVTDGLHVLWDRFVNGNKDAKFAYLGRNNPFYSDMSTMLRHMDRDVMQGCADIINIFISSLTGVNPQLVSNWTAAWMDKASGNRELSNEWGLFAARLVNTPKSQLENIYFEEVGLIGSECSNYTPEQLAMRFANYQVRMGYSIIPSSCVGDSALTKQKNYAFKIIKEKMNNSIDKDTQQKYEQFSASINEGKKKVGEAKNKYINGVIDGAQLFASLQYSKDYDIYRKYAKYDAELTKVVNIYLNCESTKEAKFLINSIRDIRRNLVESYDATLSGDADKENASATKLDESVSKFWDDYYEMNPKALEKEQRKREVDKALSKQ